MGLERIVIEVSGDPKKLKSTISELQKIGIIDEKNSKTFIKNNDKFKKGVKQSTDKLKGMTNVLGAVGVGLTAAFAAQKLQQAFKFILDSTKNFEAQMARVKAITGATGAEFRKLADDAKRLGASTKFTATQVGQLQEAYGKLGFSTQEILNASEATLQLATATGEGLAASAEVAGSTLRAFGLDASETQRVVDVMAKSFTSSALDLESFRESMKLVAPIAKAANIPIETTTALLGKLADSGLKGSLAGTSLKNLLSKLADANSDLSKELGFSVKNTSDLFAAFRQLKSGNIDLTKATELTDERSKAAFLTLLNGVDSVEQLETALNGATGAAEEMADIVQNTLQGDIDSMNSAMEALAITIGEGDNSVNAAFRGLTQAITTNVRTLANAITTSQGFGKTMKNLFGLMNSNVNPAFAAHFDAQLRAEIGIKKTEQAIKDIEEALENATSDWDEHAITVKTASIKYFELQKLAKEVPPTFEELKNRLGEVKKEMLQQALAGDISKKSLQEFKDITEQLEAAQNKLKRALGGVTGIIKRFKAGKKAKIIDPKEVKSDAEETEEVMQDHSDALIKIKEDEAKRLEAIRIAEAEEYARQLESIREGSQQFFIDLGNIAFDMNRQNLDKQMMDLEEQKRFELQMAGDNAKARENIEKKFADEELKIRRKQAANDKNQAVFNAALSTFVAATKALEAGGISGPILAALITALGIAQQIKIANTPLPKFEKGGFIDGQLHSQGGTVVEAERDEFIVNRIAAKRNKELLQDLNSGKIIAYNRPKNIAGTFADNVAASLSFNDQNLLRAIKTASRKEVEAFYQVADAIKDRPNPRRI